MDWIKRWLKVLSQQVRYWVFIMFKNVLCRDLTTSIISVIISHRNSRRCPWPTCCSWWTTWCCSCCSWPACSVSWVLCQQAGYRTGWTLGGAAVGGRVGSGSEEEGEVGEKADIWWYQVGGTYIVQGVSGLWYQVKEANTTESNWAGKYHELVLKGAKL